MLSKSLKILFEPIDFLEPFFAIDVKKRFDIDMNALQVETVGDVANGGFGRFGFMRGALKNPF